MNDLDLLFIFAKRETWEKYNHLVKDHNVSKETLEILKSIRDYYTVDSARLIIDWNSFSTFFKLGKPMKEETSQMYTKIFSNLAGMTSSLIEKDILDYFINRDYLTRIADLSLRGAEGTKKVSMDDITTLCEECNTTLGVISTTTNYIIHDDIHGLLSHVVGSGGLDWRLNELNVSLGPLRQGDFINITARPDAGKTTMLAAESTFMAKQLPKEKFVIWFNNEEEGRKVKFRVVQAALGRTTKAIEADPISAWKDYATEIGDVNKIIIYDRPSFSVRDVEAVLKEYNPGLIIFDQLRKVKGYEKESSNDVGRLQLLFQQAREWAKEYAPVINVHQARGDAEGQRWIELNQMHGSQTDIQGEADAIISLGRTHEPGLEYSRFIYLPKNKLAGGPLSNERERNGKFEVLIQPEIARYKGSL